MLTKSAHCWLNTMLIIAFFPKNEVWKYTYISYALPEKQVNLTLRVMVSKKVLGVRYSMLFRISDI